MVQQSKKGSSMKSVLASFVRCYSRIFSSVKQTYIRVKGGLFLVLRQYGITRNKEAFRIGIENDDWNR